MPKYLFEANYTPEGLKGLKQAGAASRVERLLQEIRSLLELTRARDFNLASDALESRIRLRTLGEVLAPASDGLIDERVVAVLPQFFASLEELPPEAPPPKAR